MKLILAPLVALLAVSVAVLAQQNESSNAAGAAEKKEKVVPATPRPSKKKSSAAATPRPAAKKGTVTKKGDESAPATRADSPAKSSATSSKTSSGPASSAKTKEPGTRSTADTDQPLPAVPAKTGDTSKSAEAKAAGKTTAAVDPAAPPPGQVGSDVNASIDTKNLIEFESQPPRVRKLIEAALALTRRNLTYTYGSADPANGGMDCSGFIYHVLREQGFTDVPRAANEQYVWVRKANAFDAVLSKKKQSFEFDDLLPGDLLFWTGTYTTERDPPVTHAMIFLGTERDTKQRVMVGSSDGRTYRGKARWGVSVFDFQGGQTSKDPAKAGRGGFVGYATIPGLRS